MTDSLRRLGDAMQLWFEHRAAPGGSDAELLQRHPELRDLLEPLLAAAPAAAEVRFGEFRLEYEIGRGGMGVVHAAVQESLGRRVALKVLAGASPGPQAIGRFRRESELLARLRHEHLVQVYEAGMAEGVPWFAMEFVDGCSLADVMQQLRADPAAPADGEALAAAHAAVLGDPQAGTRLRASSHTAAAVQCLLPIGDALAFAHRNRVLHRDVKPANILLRRCGTPLLGDFGLARDLRDPSITATGNFAGTPHYVAPEQVGGQQAVDERADVFALGVVLYELLLLQRPFDGASSEAVLHCVQHTEPPALAGRSPGLSADVAAVLEKALQKHPQDRYASMADFVADLRCLLAMQPVRARRSGPLGRWWHAVRRQPRRTALLAVAATSLAGVVWLSAYLWTQRPRLAAADRAERIPQVEASLEDAMLARYAGDEVAAAAALRTAERLLPDLPEIAVERLRQHGATTPTTIAAPADGADFQSHLTLPLPTVEPSTALGWFVRGTTALEAFAAAGERAHLPVAAKALRRAIDRAAAPRAIYHCQLLRALLLHGDHDGVRNLVGDIQHRWPGTPFATFWCGTALIGLDPERAVVDVRRTLAGHPHHPHLQALLAQLLVTAAPQESIAGADAAIAARPDWVAPRLIKARALLEVGQATAALAVCDEARAMAPRNASAMAGRGRVLAVLGRFDEAIEATDDAIRTAPHAAHPHIQQAYVRARQGRPELELAAAERAVAAEPFDLKAMEALGTAQGSNGRYADAAATFARLVQFAPRHANAWLDLGSARVKCGEWDAAETALRTASQLRPDDGRPHIQLGLVAAQRRDLATAEACFRTALQCAPGNAEARLRLAALLFQRREFAAGLQLCSEARQLAPAIDQGYTLAIRALQASGQTPAAIDLLVEYCQQRPGGIGPRLELCELLLAAEPDGADLAPAVRALAEADASEAGRGDVAFWRGELALRNDDPAAAADAFAAAAAHPTTPANLQTRARERLQQLGH